MPSSGTGPKTWSAGASPGPRQGVAIRFPTAARLGQTWGRRVETSRGTRAVRIAAGPVGNLAVQPRCASVGYSAQHRGTVRASQS